MDRREFLAKSMQTAAASALAEEPLFASNVHQGGRTLFD